MKRILILIIGLIGVAYGQSQPTSAKTRFVNGIYLGTKLDSYFAAADSNAIYWRADSALMAKYKGTARRVVFSGELGSYLPIADTATMLSPYLRRTDSTGLLSQVVRTFGTQTIGGNKTFTNDIFASTARIGIGAGGNTSNAVLGYNVFTANTTGTKNTAMGENSLSSNVSATDNTAFGWYSLDATTGSGNTGIGSGALGTNTSGSNNTALGFGAGEYVTGTNPNSTGTNSIYIGFNTKAAANGETNQTVIGHNLTGNGSNTVTIGNSSVTGNYFNGFLKQTSVTSSVLKADASGVVSAAAAGTDYQAPITNPVTGTGTTNYIPKFTASGGAIGNSIAFESVGRITFESTNISPLLVNGTATNGGFLTIQKGGVDLGFFGSSESISASANKFDISARTGKGLALYTNASSTAAIDISTSNAVTLTGALSGTSLSMSGGGSFGGGTSAATLYSENSSSGDPTSLSSVPTTNVFGFGTSPGGMLAAGIGTTGGTHVWMQGRNKGAAGVSYTIALQPLGGDVLIGTTTTDGTNKLIVNGGVKGTDAFFSGSVNLTKDGSNSPAAGPYFLWQNAAITRQYFAQLNASNNIDWWYFNGSTTTVKQTLNNDGGMTLTGALGGTSATFSSSVTASGYRFAYAAKSSNYTLTDNDDYINVTSSCTITLPTAVGRSGKRYVIKCVGSVTATIASTSSQTIDGNTASTYTFGGPNFNIMIVYSDGANWFLEAWQTGI